MILNLSVAKRQGWTTLGRYDAAFFQCPVQELKVWLLKQTFCWTFWIAAICNDDIELVLPIRQKFETVTDVRGDVWVLEAYAHAWKVFLRETNHGLIDVAEDCSFDCGVFDDFAEHTAITTADNENGFGVGVRVHGEVGNHFLVTVPLSVKPR